MRKTAVLGLCILLVGAAVGSCIGSSGDDTAFGMCGNGIIDPGEQCDDGNNVDHDGCSARCMGEGFCGNGDPELGEECDDGNYIDGDGCNASCEVEVGCGNGVLDVGEECDDDNVLDNDGCSAYCEDYDGVAQCGNNIHEVGEGCDDGNLEGGDGCAADCSREDGCGNGVKEGSELCDDGNNVNGDGCSMNCYVEFICGNEVCEETNYETCELCPQDCCPKCGDGTLDEEEEEECDDGNNEPGDGCSKGCQDEVAGAECGNNIWEVGEECDDGNTTVHDGCSDTCVIEYECGDMECEDDMGETCEVCPFDCCPGCGNGVREVMSGEQCDIDDLGGKTCLDYCWEGGTLSCTSYCTLDFSGCTGTPPSCGDGVAECEEQCDDTDLKGKDCQSVGYTAGTLDCNANCTFDKSQCTGLVWYLWDDFENQTDVFNNWQFSGDWEWGQPSGVDEEPTAAYDGLYVLGTGIGHDYSNSQQYFTNMVVSPQVDLTQATDPRLTFKTWIAMEGCCDGANVWVSTDGALTWNLLTDPSIAYNTTINSQSAWNGRNLESWNTIIYDMSSYIGETVHFGFAMYTDGSVTYSGYFLDNVLVTESNMIPADITTDNDLRFAVVDNHWSRNILAEGGTGTFDWTIEGGNNRDWLHIDPVTGTLSGTPLAANLGAGDVLVRATVPGTTGNFDEELFTFDVVQGIWYEGFDSSNGGFTLLAEWEWGTPSLVGPSACYGGSCLGTTLDANVPNNQSWTGCTATSPAIDLTGTTAPVMQFWTWFDTESCCDGGNIKISTNGTTFNRLDAVTPAYTSTSIGGEPAWSGHTWNTGWQLWEADLSAFAGDTIYIRFAFRTDGSVLYTGWYIDEILIMD